MKRSLIALLLLVCCAAPSGGAEPPQTAHAERRYRQCPGSAMLGKAVDISWKARRSVEARHRDLRARLNLDFPEARDRILLHSFGSHHSTVEFSIVGVRRPDGIWDVDEAGQETGGLLPTEPRIFPHKRYRLSAAESRQVDALVADPCLLAAPTYLRDPNIVAGGAEQTLEIVAGRRYVILSWFGMRTPEAEKLIELVARD